MVITNMKWIWTISRRVSTAQTGSCTAALGLCYSPKLPSYSLVLIHFCHQQVYTVEEHGMDILMWSSSRNEENKWMYGSVVLSSNSPFRVAFEAEVGWSQPTEFALDDISFTPECIAGGMLLHNYISICSLFRGQRKLWHFVFQCISQSQNLTYFLFLMVYRWQFCVLARSWTYK